MGITKSVIKVSVVNEDLTARILLFKKGSESPHLVQLPEVTDKDVPHVLHIDFKLIIFTFTKNQLITLHSETQIPFCLFSNPPRHSKK